MKMKLQLELVYANNDEKKTAITDNDIPKCQNF